MNKERSSWIFDQDLSVLEQSKILLLSLRFIFSPSLTNVLGFSGSRDWVPSRVAPGEARCGPKQCEKADIDFSGS
jgi:hypothetical protein